MYDVLDRMFGEQPNIDKKTTPLTYAVDQARKQGYEVPPKPEVTATVELITPEGAQHLLDTMPTNRKLSERHINMLATDIEKGRFFTTNQGIGIDENGLTIDGQHRLHAIIRSGKPQWMLVVRNLPYGVMLALDKNRRRTLANHYQILEKGHATLVAATARVVAKALTAWGKDFKMSTARSSQFSDFELMDVAEQITEEIDMDRAALAARGLHDPKAGGVGIPPSVGAAFYYLAKTHYGGDEVERFIEEMRGIGTYEGRAAFKLRNKMPEFKAHNTDNLTLLAYLIVAFTKHLDDEKVTYLRMPKDGRLPKMPTRD